VALGPWLVGNMNLKPSEAVSPRNPHTVFEYAPCMTVVPVACRWVWDACFSADSAYLVTASSDFSAKLWDVHSGKVIRNYGSQMAITAVALNDAQG